MKKAAAGLLAVLMVYSSVAPSLAEAGFWQERRQAAGRNPNPQFASAGLLPRLETALPGAAHQRVERMLPDRLKQDLPPSFLEKYRPLLGAIPENYGTLRRVHLPPHKDPAKVVVHIQDVHLNPEAQENIGRAVEGLMDPRFAGLVALEGTWETLDFTRPRSYPHRDIMRDTADYLLRENFITGPVRAALARENSSYLPDFIGVENPGHYQANVDAYKAAAPKIESVKKALSQKRVELESRKAAVFPPALMDFDRRVESHRSGKLSLGEYVKTVASDSRQSTDVLHFLEALRVEESLDFNQVEQERGALIRRLAGRLDKNGSDDLLSWSLAYRAGEMRYADFYGKLKALCAKSGVALSGFPAMEAYVRYVLLADGIDPEKLLKDIQFLERKRFESLAKTPEEKSLVAASRTQFLTERLADFALTPEEWKEYKETPGGTRPSVDNLDDGLASFEAFYRAAEARDIAMSDNLLRAMDERKTSVAVLVTGGFHAPGIAESLRRSGAAVVSVAPKITKVDSAAGSAYLSVFTREKTPLEKLFAGEKLFLAQNPYPKEARLMAAVLNLCAELSGEGGPANLSSDEIMKRIGAGGEDVAALGDMRIKAEGGRVFLRRGNSGWLEVIDRKGERLSSKEIQTVLQNRNGKRQTSHFVWKWFAKPQIVNSLLYLWTGNPVAGVVGMVVEFLGFITTIMLLDGFSRSLGVFVMGPVFVHFAPVLGLAMVLAIYSLVHAWVTIKSRPDLARGRPLYLMTWVYFKGFLPYLPGALFIFNPTLFIVFSATAFVFHFIKDNSFIKRDTIRTAIKINVDRYLRSMGINDLSIHPDAFNLLVFEAEQMSTDNVEWVLRNILGKVSGEKFSKQEVRRFFEKSEIVPRMMLYRPQRSNFDANRGRVRQGHPTVAFNVPMFPAVAEGLARKMAVLLEETFHISKFVTEKAAGRLYVVGKYNGGIIPAALMSLALSLPYKAMTKYPFEVPLQPNEQLVESLETHNRPGSMEYACRMAVQKEDTVIIVDDEATSGDVHSRTVADIAAAGVKTTAVSVFYRSSETSERRFQAEGVSYVFLDRGNTDPKTEIPTPVYEELQPVKLSVENVLISPTLETDHIAQLKLVTAPGSDGKIVVDHELNGNTLSFKPELLKIIGKRLASAIQAKIQINEVRTRSFEQSKTMYVMGIAPSGLLSGFAVAETLRMPYIIASDRTEPLGYERTIRYKSPDGRMRLIFGLVPGDNVIIVNGSITSGEEEIACIKALREAGIHVVCVASPLANKLLHGDQRIRDMDVPTVVLQEYAVDEKLPYYGEKNPPLSYEELLSDDTFINFNRWVGQAKKSTNYVAEVDVRKKIGIDYKSSNSSINEVLDKFDYILRLNGISYIIYRPEGGAPFAVRSVDRDFWDESTILAEQIIGDRKSQILSLSDMARQWGIILNKKKDEYSQDYTETPYFNSLMYGTGIYAHSRVLRVVRVLGAGADSKVFEVVDQENQVYALQIGRKNNFSEKYLAWNKLYDFLKSANFPKLNRLIKYLDYDSHTNSILMPLERGDRFEEHYLNQPVVSPNELIGPLKVLCDAAETIGMLWDLYGINCWEVAEYNLLVQGETGFLVDPRISDVPAEQSIKRDVFRFGVILYKLVSGNSIPNEMVSRWKQLISEGKQRELNEEINQVLIFGDNLNWLPVELKEIIKNACSYSYGSPTELANQLRHLVEGLELQGKAEADVAYSISSKDRGIAQKVLERFGLGELSDIRIVGAGLYSRPWLVTTSTGKKFVIKSSAVRKTVDTLRFEYSLSKEIRRQAEIALLHNPHQEVWDAVDIKETPLGEHCVQLDGNYYVVSEFIATGKSWTWTDWDKLKKDSPDIILSAYRRFAWLQDALWGFNPEGKPYEEGQTPSIEPGNIEVSLQQLDEAIVRIKAFLKGRNASPGLREIVRLYPYIREQYIKCASTLKKFGYDQFPKLPIHRDITPFNFFWTRDRPKLIDFDLAKHEPRIIELINNLILRQPLNNRGEYSLDMDLLIKCLLEFQKITKHPLSRGEIYAIPELIRLNFLVDFSFIAAMKEVRDFDPKYDKWETAFWDQEVWFLKYLDSMTENDWLPLYNALGVPKPSSYILTTESLALEVSPEFESNASDSLAGESYGVIEADFGGFSIGAGQDLAGATQIFIRGQNGQVNILDIEELRQRVIDILDMDIKDGIITWHEFLIILTPIVNANWNDAKFQLYHRSLEETFAGIDKNYNGVLDPDEIEVLTVARLMELLTMISEGLRLPLSWQVAGEDLDATPIAIRTDTFRGGLVPEVSAWMEPAVVRRLGPWLGARMSLLLSRRLIQPIYEEIFGGGLSDRMGAPRALRAVPLGHGIAPLAAGWMALGPLSLGLPAAAAVFIAAAIASRLWFLARHPEGLRGPPMAIAAASLLVSSFIVIPSQFSVPAVLLALALQLLIHTIVNVRTAGVSAEDVARAERSLSSGGIAEEVERALSGRPLDLGVGHWLVPALDRMSREDPSGMGRALRERFGQNISARSLADRLIGALAAGRPGVADFFGGLSVPRVILVDDVRSFEWEKLAGRPGRVVLVAEKRLEADLRAAVPANVSVAAVLPDGTFAAPGASDSPSRPGSLDISRPGVREALEEIFRSGTVGRTAFTSIRVGVDPARLPAGSILRTVEFQKMTPNFLVLPEAVSLEVSRMYETLLRALTKVLESA